MIPLCAALGIRASSLLLFRIISNPRKSYRIYAFPFISMLSFLWFDNFDRILDYLIH